MSEPKNNAGAPESEQIKDAKRNFQKTASRRLTKTERAEKEEKTPFRNDPRRSKPQ